jgi:hypothetical protein
MKNTHTLFITITQTAAKSLTHKNGQKPAIWDRPAQL